MTKHPPECFYFMDDFGDGERCICDRLRACEERVRKDERNKWSDLAHDNWQDGWEEGLHAAREAIAAAHRPLPVIECACGWGYDCPACGPESNRVVGYACAVCCDAWPHTAYCDDMHNEDDTPLHHLGGAMWSGPHCPVIALIDALRAAE